MPKCTFERATARASPAMPAPTTSTGCCSDEVAAWLLALLLLRLPPRRRSAHRWRCPKPLALHEAGSDPDRIGEGLAGQRTWGWATAMPAALSGASWARLGARLTAATQPRWCVVGRRAGRVRCMVQSQAVYESRGETGGPCIQLPEGERLVYVRELVSISWRFCASPQPTPSGWGLGGAVGHMVYSYVIFALLQLHDNHCRP